MEHILFKEALQTLRNNLETEKNRFEIAEKKLIHILNSFDTTRDSDEQFAQHSKMVCDQLAAGRLILPGQQAPVTLPPEVITQLNKWANMSKILLTVKRNVEKKWWALYREFQEEKSGIAPNPEGKDVIARYRALLKKEQDLNMSLDQINGVLDQRDLLGRPLSLDATSLTSVDGPVFNAILYQLRCRFVPSPVEAHDVSDNVEAQPQAPYGAASAQPQAGYDVALAQPQAGYGMASAQPQAGYGMASAQPQAGYGMASAQPQAGYGMASAQPQAGYGMASAQPQAGYGAASAQPEAGYGAASAQAGVIPQGTQGRGLFYGRGNPPSFWVENWPPASTWFPFIVERLNGYSICLLACFSTLCALFSSDAGALAQIVEMVEMVEKMLGTLTATDLKNLAWSLVNFLVKRAVSMSIKRIVIPPVTAAVQRFIQRVSSCFSKKV